jgi:hypothetical protein
MLDHDKRDCPISHEAYYISWIGQETKTTISVQVLTRNTILKGDL